MVDKRKICSSSSRLLAWARQPRSMSHACTVACTPWRFMRRWWVNVQYALPSYATHGEAQHLCRGVVTCSVR